MSAILRMAYSAVMLLSSVAAVLGGCTFLPGHDCDGDDIAHRSGPPAVMTQDACCALCAATKKCNISVHIPAFNGNASASACLLKSRCSDPQPVGDRTRCCQDGDIRCTPVKPLSCAEPPLSSAPFCDAALPVAKRVADLVGSLLLRRSAGCSTALPTRRLPPPVRARCCASSGQAARALTISAVSAARHHPPVWHSSRDSHCQRRLGAFSFGGGRAFYDWKRARD